MRSTSLVTMVGLSLVLGLGACDGESSAGNNSADAGPEDGAAPGDDAAQPDAGPDGAVGCAPGDPTATPHGRLAVATEQFGSGGAVSVVNLGDLSVDQNVALTHDDVTIRWFDGQIWVLNRFGADNVMVLDGSDYSIIRQFSVGAGCNPHDLLFVSTCKAYVTCYDQSALAIVDPTANPGEEVVGSIDLGSLADADGLPEMDQMAFQGGQVYITLQRLENFVVTAYSSVAVIDPDSDQLVGEIQLETTDPFTALINLPGTADLIVGTVADFSGGANAGLERIDTAGGVSTLELSGADLGGLAGAFTLDNQGCGFIVVSDPVDFSSGLTAFCLDGSGISPCIADGVRTITDVTQLDDGRLAVGDADFADPGIRLYDPGSCNELTVNVLATGFAPGFTNPLLPMPAP